MKPITTVLLLIMAFCINSCMLSSQPSTASNFQDPNYQRANYQGGTQVSLQLFYDQLSPYGTWVSYQNYGYVWMPNVGPGFQPYGTSGHWVLTDMGWTWYSTYSWGWAPFHYGRWFFDNSYGWMWLPDTQWGPAWVTWRSGQNYYGWAPMEPGISINIAFGGTYQAPANRWIFVNSRDIDRHNIYSYSIKQTNNTTIINNTTVIQNTRQDRTRGATYVTGPDRDDVQRVKGRPVKQVIIHENVRPGQNINGREMRIYKPNVHQDQDNRRQSAPAKVERLNNVKPVNERYQTRPSRNPPRTIDNRNQNNVKPKKQPKKKGNNN